MRNDLVMTKEKIIDERVKNSFTLKSEMYRGDKDAQKTQTEFIRNSKNEAYKFIVSADTKVWKNSAEYTRLWSKIEDSLKNIKEKIDAKMNLNQFPDDYYDLVQKTLIDLTRRRIEEEDFTSMFTNEITNPNFSQSINLREFLPFAGVFEKIEGTGDSVPMLQQKTGAMSSVDVELAGLGHARSFEDELYNLDIFNLEKVNVAVNRAYTGARNHINFFPLIQRTQNGTWNASQVVPADTTGATYDVRLYLTLRNAIRRLVGLLDPQTGQEINASNVVLLVGNNVIEWDIQRIINGQLEKFGTPVENRSGLPINQIWKYKGDRITVGPKTTTYPGVPDGTAYLFVTGPAGAPIWTLNKRNLTMEIGSGDVLKLIHEKRAWYFGQAVYREEFLGSSSTALGLANGYGYVVTIDLPEEPDET